MAAHDWRCAELGMDAPVRRIVEWTNLGAALAALLLSSYAVVRAAPAPEPPRAGERAAQTLAVAPITRTDGTRVLVDASGAEITVGGYHRVASGSLLADPLVLALCAPDDIVAFSARAPQSPDAHRYAGKPSIDALHRQEQLLVLRPDLVLVNSLGEHAWVR